MTKLVPLSKIKDNPYRDKKRNPLDKDKIAQLVESIGTTGFWKGVYGREVGERVEIAFGHNRVEAARAAGLLEIPVEIEKFTDSDMLMRMTRENLRGELQVAVEAVNAAVKAYGQGAVKFDGINPKTKLSSIRYAPSFVPSKSSSTSGVDHPYTTDSLARFLGGVYLKRGDNSAQNSVVAALGILEMEERKVEGFTERSLQTVTDEGAKFLSSKKIIQIVNDVKQREVKVIERREKTAAELAEIDKKQRELQAERKAAEKAEKDKRDKLVADIAKAKAAEDAEKAKALKAKLDAQEEHAVEKDIAFQVKAAELDKKVEQRKQQEAAAKQEDAYLRIKREVERILHKLQGETATTKEALVAEVKALGREPLNTTDRERLRQAAISYGTWYTEWVSNVFLPPLSSQKKLNEYRTREAANRRAQEAKEEKARLRAEKKAAKEKKK